MRRVGAASSVIQVDSGDDDDGGCLGGLAGLVGGGRFAEHGFAFGMRYVVEAQELDGADRAGHRGACYLDDDAPVGEFGGASGGVLGVGLGAEVELAAVGDDVGFAWAADSASNSLGEGAFVGLAQASLEALDEAEVVDGLLAEDDDGCLLPGHCSSAFVAAPGSWPGSRRKAFPAGGPAAR